MASLNTTTFIFSRRDFIIARVERSREEEEEEEEDLGDRSVGKTLAVIRWGMEEEEDKVVVGGGK